MTYKSKISSALLPALFACGAASLTGCAEQGDEQIDSPHADAQASGQVSLALELAPGVDVNSVRYQVTGNGFFRSRTVAVGSGSHFSVFVGGIPAGHGYTVTVEAGGSAQAVSCMGTATFSVTAGQTSTATVTLSCLLNQDSGGVIIDANTNLCPVLEDLMVAPTRVSVGDSIELEAVANDLDAAPQAVSYRWTSTIGDLTNASSATASLACATAGEGTVTLTYSDGACSQTMQVAVRCDAGGEEPGEPGQIRITEWMYDGAGGEWVELTNVGGAPVDLTGWSYDDDSATVGVFSLSGFGVVQPGESVVFTEATVAAFRSAWGSATA
jgi:hypothetical protein